MVYIGNNQRGYLQLKSLGWESIARGPIVIFLAIWLILLAACTPTTQTPVTTTPSSSIQREEVFPKVMERVVSLAQTPEAKEYVSLFFPPFAMTSEYQKEHRAWATTITTLRPDTLERMESFDWRPVDCEKYLSLLFGVERWSGYWLVYDDGRILPMGWALVMEADIERLNTKRALGGLAPVTVPAPKTSSTVTSSGDITSMPAAYDGKEVELLGQTYFTGIPSKLVIDGKSGVNLAGNTASLHKGFYRIKGLYDADTNTLNVTDAIKEEVKYTKVEAGKGLGISLIAVAIQGLVATPPKEVASILTSYLSIPNSPKDVPIYPYVVYGKDGFYLALSDTLIELPVKFTFLYQGKDYSFTFSAGEVKGTLIKTPSEKMDFGLDWAPGEFSGVIIADTISPLEAEETTVREINANPSNFIFKRVAINGSYIVTTATVDYSEIKVPMGQGILADEFSDFFKEDSNVRLETIDPGRKVWQLRQGRVVGTVTYPTDQILRYLNYSAPLSQSEIKGRLKPALIVDTLVDEVQQVANISELNPVLGKPSQYWGKVVEFDGYALGINYPLKKVAQAILNTEVPVNVNLQAVGIADKPAIGSQLAIIGLNNDLIGGQGEIIKGKYRFKVAVTHVPEQLTSGVPYADTAFFLLSKEELPTEMPKSELYSLNVSINPSGGGSVALTPPGASYPPGTLVTLVAIPTIGYVFDHWSGDVSGTSASITIVIDRAKSISAYFRRIF